ncbi:hypothetical protein GCM10009864_50510 [Streptomyces lunalinharesii]|uniref:Secreted protein n=1 Tax=Streptomyces lunalinharesii TaxID=333384 RepID=A0ABN3SE90_9ACTN
MTAAVAALAVDVAAAAAAAAVRALLPSPFQPAMGRVKERAGPVGLPADPTDGYRRGGGEVERRGGRRVSRGAHGSWLRGQGAARVIAPRGPFVGGPCSLVAGGGD